MSARSATALRLEIEHALERSFPAALTPAQRTIHETASTGIAEVDALLDGGLPIGAISEVSGPESSGRTTLVLSFLAQRTASGHVCAWVDADDAFDPESAAANGVNLRQLLWVRCRKAGGSVQTKQAVKPWTRLDQALRATDLLLQAGGFAAIVLDLGDTAAEHARRIPLATWFRFRQAADRARTSLVVLAQAETRQRSPVQGSNTQGTNAQSSAALALQCAAIRPMIAGGKVLRGFRFEVRNERQRFTPFAVGRKKPPASVWPAASAWDATGTADAPEALHPEALHSGSLHIVDAVEDTEAAELEQSA
ncbi:MAG: hypothetical protein WA802_01405 [Terracidiphilus sp.]